MGLLFKLAWRSIWRNRRRTIITIASISFSLALATFFIAFADGMYAKLIDDAVRMQAGHITVEDEEYRDAPAIDLVVDGTAALRKDLSTIPGVERTKVLVVGQGVAKSGMGAIGVAVIGIEPEAEAGSSLLARKIVAGSYLEPGDHQKIVVGKKLAERLKLESARDLKKLRKLILPLAGPFDVDPKAVDEALRIHLSIGKKLVITSNNVDGQIVEQLVRVKGIFDTGTVELDAFITQIPIDFARKLYGMKADQATQVGVLVVDPDSRDQVMEQVQRVVGERDETAAVLAPVPVAASLGAGSPDPGSGLAVRTWEQVLPDLAAYIEIDGGSNYVFQGILFFLVMFTIFNTILMSVLERRREFAVLLAIGTPLGRLKSQVLLETIFIALIGVIIGLGIGGGAAYYFQVHGMDLTELYSEGVAVSGMAIDPVIYAMVTPELLATIGGLVFFCTLLLSLYPMGRIRRIPVADVLR